MQQPNGYRTIATWPGVAREAAALVIETYGEPHEVTETRLVWYGVGGWKRVVAQRQAYRLPRPGPSGLSVVR